MICGTKVEMPQELTKGCQTWQIKTIVGPRGSVKSICQYLKIYSPKYVVSLTKMLNNFLKATGYCSCSKNLAQI